VSVCVRECSRTFINNTIHHTHIRTHTHTHTQLKAISARLSTYRGIYARSGGSKFSLIRYSVVCVVCVVCIVGVV
jgi:hypothetical protein